MIILHLSFNCEKIYMAAKIFYSPIKIRIISSS
nr:MAG TPA: hypothetical protein [Caudoviricetes sp.]